MNCPNCNRSIDGLAEELAQSVDEVLVMFCTHCLAICEATGGEVRIMRDERIIQRQRDSVHFRVLLRVRSVYLRRASTLRVECNVTVKAVERGVPVIRFHKTEIPEITLLGKSPKFDEPK